MSSDLYLRRTNNEASFQITGLSSKTNTRTSDSYMQPNKNYEQRQRREQVSPPTPARHKTHNRAVCATHLLLPHGNHTSVVPSLHDTWKRKENWACEAGNHLVWRLRREGTWHIMAWCEIKQLPVLSCLWIPEYWNRRHLTKQVTQEETQTK